MTWVSILSAILAIAKALTEWLHDRQIIDGATAASALKGLQDADSAIALARKAREVADLDDARDGDPRVRDDGFRRPD